MLNINDLFAPPSVKKIKQPIYVGLPGINSVFTVHPVDQSPSNQRAYLFYSKEDSCTYIIKPNDEGCSRLIANGVYNLFEAVLYRGIYTDGTEFLIPLSSYGNAYEQSVKKMLDEARSGLWLTRKEDPPHGKTQFEYELSVYPDPANWSSLTFNQLLRTTFQNHVIDSPTHPVAVAQFKPVRNSLKSN